MKTIIQLIEPKLNQLSILIVIFFSSNVMVCNRYRTNDKRKHRVRKLNSVDRKSPARKRLTK